MRPAGLARIGIGMLAAASPAAAEDNLQSQGASGVWTPIVFSDLQAPSAATASYAELWAKEIASNDAAYVASGDLRYQSGHAPASEAHFVVRSPTRTVVVSLLNTAMGCSPKTADQALGVRVKTCPLKVAIYSAGTATVTSGRVGCFIEFTGGGADPSASGMLAAYDSRGRSIKIGTLFNHEPVPGCTQLVPLYPSDQGPLVPQISPQSKGVKP